MIRRLAAASSEGAGLGIVLVVASMLGFATMDAISKLLAGGYAIPQILWVRNIFFMVFALTIIGWRGAKVALATSRPILQSVRGLVLIIENGLFVLAFRYLPLADVHAIAAASPLIVVALSVPLLGEMVGIRRWLAVAAGFFGVLLIIRPGFQTLAWPMLIPLAGALLWGVYQILVKLCSRTDSSETTLFWSALVGLASTTLIGPFTWTAPDAKAWALLLALALTGSLAHFALIKGLSYVDASAVQPYSYTLLVFAAFWGLVIFGDVPDGWTIAGAAIIVASGLYTWYRERQLSRHPAGRPTDQ